MAITLTVQSVVPSSSLVLVTTVRSDNGKNETLIVDVSSAVSAIAALNIITAAITARVSLINAVTNNLASVNTLIGQTF